MTCCFGRGIITSVAVSPFLLSSFPHLSISLSSSLHLGLLPPSSSSLFFFLQQSLVLFLLLLLLLLFILSFFLPFFLSVFFSSLLFYLCIFPSHIFPRSSALAHAGVSKNPSQESWTQQLLVLIRPFSPQCRVNEAHLLPFALQPLLKTPTCTLCQVKVLLLSPPSHPPIQTHSSSPLPYPNRGLFGI